MRVADGDAHQGVELLGGPVRDRGLLRDRRLRLDVDLGAQGLLGLDHLLGHALGERLDVGERLARQALGEVLDDLAEARHVDAGVLGAEIGEQVERRVEELGLSPSLIEMMRRRLVTPARLNATDTAGRSCCASRWTRHPGSSGMCRPPQPQATISVGAP